MNFKRLFNPQKENLTWLKILIWWEIRRIPFNIIITLGIIASIFCLSFIIKNLESFMSPGIFLIFWVLLFYFLANLCYSLGAIFQLIEYRLRIPVLSKLLPNTYFFGIIFSIIVIFIPVVICGAYTIISGNQIKSIYGDLATLKPTIKSFAGTYVITDDSRKSLKLDSMPHSTGKIVFNQDSIFVMTEFPYHASDKSLSDYLIVNASGKWSIDSSQGRWVVSLDFDSVCNQNGQKILGRYFDANSYEIQNDKPPYGIYKVVGDPDSWEGVNLLQRI